MRAGGGNLSTLMKRRGSPQRPFWRIQAVVKEREESERFEASKTAFTRDAPTIGFGQRARGNLFGRKPRFRSFASSHAEGDMIDCRIARWASERALAGQKGGRVSSEAVGWREGARGGAREGGRDELRRRLVEIRRRVNSSGTGRVFALPHLHSPRPISFRLLPLALSTASTPKGLLLLGDEVALSRHEQNGVPFLTKEVLFKQTEVAKVGLQTEKGVSFCTLQKRSGCDGL